MTLTPTDDIKFIETFDQLTNWAIIFAEAGHYFSL